MLKMNKVSKIYKKGNQEIRAIDGISLEISSGDFVSIVGPSGSGKSSLLLMLGGMLSPTAGSIAIDEQSLYEMSPSERAALRKKKVGFVFQTFNLIPYLTAIQNVQMPLLLNGVDEKNQYSKAKELLVRMGLSERLNHKPSELSVGQQQRIALARTLANDPSIILADEPTGNLDPEMSRLVIDFLAEVNQEGKTVVLVTHDMRVASRAKRTLALSTGGKLIN